MTRRSFCSVKRLGLVVCLALIGLTGCERKPARAPRQAIVFLLDAARPDRFSCYGYQRRTTPEMDRLAADGVLFRHHFAQGTATRVSVASFMSSRYYCLPLMPYNRELPYDPADLFRGPDPEQISFVKALERAGFKTAAITAHHWTGNGTAFAAEFGEMHDLVDKHSEPERPYPKAVKVIDHAIEWIGQNKSNDYYLYVHLMDTHYPHYFEADAQAFFGAPTYAGNAFAANGRMVKPELALTDDDRRYADALYDGSLHYADRHIGRLIEFLRTEGLIDRTLIAVTADHGEHMFDWPGRRTRDGLYVFRHDGPWYDAVARIPLIIRYPAKLKPQEFDEFSEGVDVGPTLLSLLDVPLPAGKSFDGMDLSRVIGGEVPAKTHVFMRSAIRTSSYKCLYTSPDAELLGGDAPDPRAVSGELYDLSSDPHEMTDIFRTRPEVVGELTALYRERLAPLHRRYQATTATGPPESAFAVSAGYMRSDPELPVTEGGPLPAGWSLRRQGSDAVLMCNDSTEPISVQFPMPSGPYQVAVNLFGGVTVQCGDLRRDLSHGGGTVEFGEIVVSGDLFRATIRPQSPRTAGLAFFGFTPPAAAGEDEEAIKQQLERLRALGYVDD